VPLLLSVVVLALALTACSESAEDEYRDELPRIDRRLAALGGDVTEGLRRAGESDESALAREFGGYARRLGELRGRLEELDPPDRLAQEHDELLAATAAVRRALAEIAAAVRRGDADAAREAATSLVREGERLDRDRRELVRAVRRL
jgi:hypothetical protein